MCPIPGQLRTSTRWENDRATRLVFLRVYEHKDKEASMDFRNRCLSFYPFHIQKILTDNGREFTVAGGLPMASYEP